MRPLEMVVPVFCSIRENIWVNHWLWQASQKSRAGSPGTRSALAAIRKSSALRLGSFSFSAISRASVAWRLAQSTIASQTMITASRKGRFSRSSFAESGSRAASFSSASFLMPLKPRCKILP